MAAMTEKPGVVSDSGATAAGSVHQGLPLPRSIEEAKAIMSGGLGEAELKLAVRPVATDGQTCRPNAYAKESDFEFIELLPKPANSKKSEEANAHADIGVVSIQRAR